MDDYWLRIIGILALGFGAYFVLRKIDPMEGKDYSGVPPEAKRKILIGLAILVVGWILFQSLK